MSLSAGEIKLVKDSWAPVYANKKESGIALFVRLFSENPGFQSQFRYLDGVSGLAAIEKTPALADHGVKVMDTVNSWVGSLGDAPALVKQLTALGTSHIALKVTPANFDAMGPVLLWTLQEKAGGAFTPAAKDAWAKGWDLMKSHIVKALQG
ncbi:cytoglobin-like [Saccoglossus kowalevskii]|uniref:Cytoglobin-1-like n=1 Tax=Saccoglossus kowalevskii TaxID=10224 RepID=A0ABM0GLD9_SACKO|nr:PREDICTED: cytoglobin-1-like [Saccoglossus kowalevskii]